MTGYSHFSGLSLNASSLEMPPLLIISSVATLQYILSVKEPCLFNSDFSLSKIILFIISLLY